MYRYVIAIGLVVAADFWSWAGAGEVGAIKRFVRFPVATFELNGKISAEVLEEETTPSPDKISVDGWWPDKKLLLISFDADSHYVLYRSVEMNDQKTWDARLAASGGLVCGGASASRRTGTRSNRRMPHAGSDPNRYIPRTSADPNRRMAGTKGFASPC